MCNKHFKWISGRKIRTIVAITQIFMSVSDGDACIYKMSIWAELLMSSFECETFLGLWLSVLTDLIALLKYCVIILSSRSTFLQLPPLQERTVQSAGLQTKKAISCSSYSQIYFRIQSILIADSKLCSPGKHVQKPYSPAMDCSSENCNFRKPQWKIKRKVHGVSQMVFFAALNVFASNEAKINVLNT